MFIELFQKHKLVLVLKEKCCDRLIFKYAVVLFVLFCFLLCFVLFLFVCLFVCFFPYAYMLVLFFFFFFFLLNTYT